MKRASGRARKVSAVDLPTREELLRIVDELRPVEPRLSFQTRTTLLKMLVQFLDQLDPARDPRVKPLPWQIAMLAVALEEKRNVQKKDALLAALETLSPGRAQDQGFRDYIERTCRELRKGKNPARAQLLPVPPELLALASANLKR